MVPSIQSRLAGFNVTQSRFLRDAAVATALLGFLYAVAPHSGIQALQIPGYLLIVGFDMLEGVFGAVHTYFDVVFWLYIVGLGLSSAVLAHGFRSLASKTSLPAWRVGLAGGLTVVAMISFLFAAVIYSGTTQSEPVRILGRSGLILLLLAALFADAFSVMRRLQAR